MSDSYIQIPPNSTGAKFDAETLAVGANTVLRQRARIAGVGATSLAKVATADPGTSDAGLIIRDVNAGTILARLQTLATRITHRVARSGENMVLPWTPAYDYSDGYYQKGLAWPNPRFTDNSNGTVTDNLTGLVWLKNGSPFGMQNLTNALASAHALHSGAYGLTDGSAAGDWRLPNINELRSLIAFQYSTPCLCDRDGTARASDGNPFTGITATPRWSTTECAYYGGYFWQYYPGSSGESNNYYTSYAIGWPVRDAL